MYNAPFAGERSPEPGSGGRQPHVAPSIRTWQTTLGGYAQAGAACSPRSRHKGERTLHTLSGPRTGNNTPYAVTSRAHSLEFVNRGLHGQRARSARASASWSKQDLLLQEIKSTGSPTAAWGEGQVLTCTSSSLRSGAVALGLRVISSSRLRADDVPYSLLFVVPSLLLSFDE